MIVVNRRYFVLGEVYFSDTPSSQVQGTPRAGVRLEGRWSLFSQTLQERHSASTRTPLSLEIAWVTVEKNARSVVSKSGLDHTKSGPVPKSGVSGPLSQLEGGISSYIP